MVRAVVASADIEYTYGQTRPNETERQEGAQTEAPDLTLLIAWGAPKSYNARTPKLTPIFLIL